MSSKSMTRNPTRNGRIALGLAALMTLSACEEGKGINFKEIFKPKPTVEAEGVVASTPGTVIERDVEAPEVFSATEAGLWDGRPSLGGVWVAHPDVKEPERVMIRNQSNGQFVVGALFRRERDIPGPRLQISSDAAQAIGVLAGAPVELDVTALRKEVVEQAPVVVETAAAAGAIDAAPEITETSLDPIAAAGAAIDAAAPTAAEGAVITPAATSAPVVSTLPVSKLDKPFLQVGIFNIEENANRTASQIGRAGLIASVESQDSNGKQFWRVLVGPASSASERKKLLTTIKNEGFSDAYPVTN